MRRGRKATGLAAGSAGVRQPGCLTESRNAPCVCPAFMRVPASPGGNHGQHRIRRQRRKRPPGPKRPRKKAACSRSPPTWSSPPRGCFSLYLKQDDNLVLYAEKSELFTDNHKERLGRLGVDHLYVRTEDYKFYAQYVQDNIKELLDDEMIPVRDRARAWNDAAVALAKEAFDKNLPGNMDKRRSARSSRSSPTRSSSSPVRTRSRNWPGSSAKATSCFATHRGHGPDHQRVGHLHQRGRGPHGRGGHWGHAPRHRQAGAAPWTSSRVGPTA